MSRHLGRKFEDLLESPEEIATSTQNLANTFFLSDFFCCLQTGIFFVKSIKVQGSSKQISHGNSKVTDDLQQKKPLNKLNSQLEQVIDGKNETQDTGNGQFGIPKPHPHEDETLSFCAWLPHHGRNTLNIETIHHPTRIVGFFSKGTVDPSNPGPQ